MTIKYQLTTSDEKAIVDVANALNTEPRWLKELILFETAGTFNPKIKNPFSSARGLIQFMDETARNMGFPGGSKQLVDTYPTFDQQLRGPVYLYLRGTKYPSKQSLFMKVFFPYAMHVDSEKTFLQMYKELYPSTWQTAYAKFAKGNPGIETPGDYVRYAEGRSRFFFRQQSRQSQMA